MQISCPLESVEISRVLKIFVPNLAQSYPHFIHKITQMQSSSAFAVVSILAQVLPNLAQNPNFAIF